MKASPVIKKLAAQMGINETELVSIQGTGKNGSIKKVDLEAFLASKPKAKKAKKKVKKVAGSQESTTIRIVYLGKPAQDISVPQGTDVAQLRVQLGIEDTILCSKGAGHVLTDGETVSFTKLIAGN